MNYEFIFTSKGVILLKNSPSFFSSIGFIKVTKVPYSEEEVSSAESFRKIAFSRKKHLSSKVLKLYAHVLRLSFHKCSRK